MILKILCGAWGTSDDAIFVEDVSTQVIPRVGEGIITKKGYYVVSEISHDLVRKHINVWIDRDQCEFHDEELIERNGE